MIELEIQTLSERREGLLMEVGRSVTASGFVLQRQRLIQDANGVLMTLVVCGPPRGQRVLEAALEAHERLISFQVSTFDEGESRPHFAASCKLPRPVVPAVTVVEPLAVPRAVADVTSTPSADPAESEHGTSTVLAEEAPTEPTEPDFEFILPTPRAAPPAAAVAEATPFVDMVPLAADERAVARAMVDLESNYPDLIPPLLALKATVVDAARESSLEQAGLQVGSWLFRRDHAGTKGLALSAAIETIAVPALRELVGIEQDGDQLHLVDSPLCEKDGHSGCAFFSGFLHGILGPALISRELTLFPVCCRSYGAGECVLALSD